MTPPRAPQPSAPGAYHIREPGRPQAACSAHAELAAEVRVLGVRLDGVEREVAGVRGEMGRLADAVERLTEADRQSTVDALTEQLAAARERGELAAAVARLTAERDLRRGTTPRGGSLRRSSLEPPAASGARPPQPPPWREALGQVQGWALAAIAAAVAAAVGGAVLAGVQAAGCQPVQRAPSVAGAGVQDAGADAR